MNDITSRKPVSLVIPPYALACIDALEQGGHEAWCVGGCVRDALLGREMHDYDVATSATWEESEQLLNKAGFDVHRTGTKHGTVTAVLSGHAIEVTTYRTDGTYSDGRHPDAVAFVRSIEEDLARRDFTMNALAYHPERGMLDCWGGCADIKRNVIRAVGDPAKRFSEDALRILRACRFASQLGFSIEPSTYQGMMANKRRIASVSAERITREIEGLLLGEHVHDALLATIDVLGMVLPELIAMKGFGQRTPYHVYDVLEHTAWVCQYTPPTPLARWAALFHDTGKPGAHFMEGDRAHFYGHPTLSATIAKGALGRFCLSQSFRDDVVALVLVHDRVVEATPRAVKRMLARLGGDVALFETLCDLKRADAMAQSDLSKPRLQLASELKAVLRDVVESGSAFNTEQLAVNGQDVMDAAGIDPGPEVGRILQELLDAVIDERVANDRDALLQLVRQSA